MDLSKVTYLSIVPNKSSKPYQNIDSIVKIGNQSSSKLNFGKKIIYTYKEPTIDPGDFEIKIIDEVPYEDFNEYITEFYANSFDTEFMINFHCDGFIQKPEAWNDNFLNYDYIGAPIILNFQNINKSSQNTVFPVIGNGGFSLRSKKLCQKIKKLKEINYLPKYLNCFNGSFISEDFYQKLPFYFRHEDVYIGLFCKDILESYGFKFPDENIASMFSTEHYGFKNGELSFNYDIYTNSFGFHEIENLKCSEKIKKFRIDLQKKLAV